MLHILALFVTEKVFVEHGTVKDIRLYVRVAAEVVRFQKSSIKFYFVTLTMNLFEQNGATFSDCRRYRYALWRIWDESKPLVMFVGINPSTANEIDADPTIRSVGRIAKNNGYGGFYMMNCFPYVSTNPNDLKDFGNTATNDHWLSTVAAKCECVVFAWGSFEVVKELGRDVEMTAMFPTAKALSVNKNGSPKHPLYCRSDTSLINFVTNSANFRFQKMELIARIDCDGRTYIGKWGRDMEWVKSGNAKPVTIVRNEYGGQNVSLEDIACARAKHRKGHNDWTAFAEDDVKSFYDNSLSA